MNGWSDLGGEFDLETELVATTVSQDDRGHHVDDASGMWQIRGASFRTS